MVDSSPSIRLVKTSSVCPEQYDVFQGDLEIGYIKLRNGVLRAMSGPRTVYLTKLGEQNFFHDNEREYYLDYCVASILLFLKGEHPTGIKLAEMKYIVDEWFYGT